MNNFERTAAWLAACGKEPDKYQVGIALSVQIGCQIEEVTEFWGSMYFDNDGANKAMQSICAHLEELAREVKSGRIKAHISRSSRVHALDALCDIEVTGNGVAYLAEMDKKLADELVLASNDAKLVDGKPVILEGGKIGKPHGWAAPNLECCV